MESTLKWILDDLGISYDEKDKLRVLYKKLAKELNLSPDQHGEEIFRKILGSIWGRSVTLMVIHMAREDDMVVRV